MHSLADSDAEETGAALVELSLLGLAVNSGIVTFDSAVTKGRVGFSLFRRIELFCIQEDAAQDDAQDMENVVSNLSAWESAIESYMEPSVVDDRTRLDASTPSSDSGQEIYDYGEEPSGGASPGAHTGVVSFSEATMGRVGVVRFRWTRQPPRPQTFMFIENQLEYLADRSVN